MGNVCLIVTQSRLKVITACRVGAKLLYCTNILLLFVDLLVLPFNGN